MFNENQEAPAQAQTCPAVAYQSSTVCVPVTVSPFARAGTTVTRCCGSPVVTPGRNTCDGTRNGVCTFTISQNICVAVPVEFGAAAVVGESFVTCNRATSTDICASCSDDDIDDIYSNR